MTLVEAIPAPLTARERQPAGPVMAVRVLDADRDLARRLGSVAADARPAVIAGAVALAPGVWDPTGAFERVRDGYGLLLIAGLLLRDLHGSEALGAELLSRGDLLGPEDGTEEAIAGLATRWDVLEPTRLLVLDHAFSQRVAAFPAIGAVLAERAHDRARRAAITLALSNLPRVEDRLYRLLWYLADRLGRVSVDGVRLDLPLTQEQLGRLVGARRPTVSLALRSLRERGVVGRGPAGVWLLAHQELATQPRSMVDSKSTRP